MIYTNIPKPGAQTYTSINTQGKQQYDQTDILYDSAMVFYDSINTGAYTNVSKPVSQIYTNVTKPS